MSGEKRHRSSRTLLATALHYACQSGAPSAPGSLACMHRSALRRIMGDCQPRCDLRIGTRAMP